MTTLLLGVLIMAQTLTRPTTAVVVVAKPQAPTQPKLQDRVYAKCRQLGYSHEDSQQCWARCYEFLVANKRGDEWVEPKFLGREHVESHLTTLARSPGKTARGPQQAFNALSILYQYVLGIPGVVVDQEEALRKRLEERVRALGQAENTYETYWSCISRFRRWLGLRFWQAIKPEMLSRKPVQTYLSTMANDRRNASSTQNLALQAILYVARELYGIKIEGIDADRAKRGKYLPTVLSREEVQRLFKCLNGEMKLLAMLLYGCGLRLNEAVCLRRKDIDLDRETVTVWFAKGKKSRILPLPKMAKAAMIAQLERTEHYHTIDTQAGLARVPLWDAFDRKSPTAESQLGNYWVFCSHQRSRDPKTTRIGRYHIDKSNAGRRITAAGRLAKNPKRTNPHSLRHSYATHSLEMGMPIHQLQANLGHNKLETTEIYLHVARKPESEVNPLDSLLGVGHCGTTVCAVCRARIEIPQSDTITWLAKDSWNQGIKGGRA